MDRLGDIDDIDDIEDWESTVGSLIDQLATLRHMNRVLERRNLDTQERILLHLEAFEKRLNALEAKLEEWIWCPDGPGGQHYIKTRQPMLDAFKTPEREESKAV